MRIFATAAILLSVGILHAQKINVKWSEESKKELEYKSLVKGAGTEMVKLCFESQGGGFFSKRKITPILSRYDNKLVEQGVKSFAVDDDGMDFNGLMSVKGNLYMFSSKYDKGQKATTFYAQKIDANNLNPIGRPSNLGTMSAVNRDRATQASFVISKDSSKILFFGLAPYEKKQNEKYYMGVYDNQLNKLWETTVELPYLGKFVDVLDFDITNAGEVGVLLKHYDKEVRKEKVREEGANIPAYKTKFLLYAKGEKKPKEYVLDLKDKFVHTLQITADNNSNLTLFGLYKNKYDGYINGYFITSINKAGNSVDLKKMEVFPEDVLALCKKDKQASTKERDPGLSAKFYLADVVQRDDKTIDYLLEYYKLVERTYTDSRGGWHTTWYYYYGDIVDVHVTDKKTNFIRVPKWQETVNTGLYSSFKALTSKNKLYLFYNDDRDNVERDLSKRPDDMVRFTKSVLAVAALDQNDNLSRSAVYDHKQMKLTTCVNVCQKLSNDKIGLYAQRTGGLFSSSKDMVGILQVD